MTSIAYITAPYLRYLASVRPEQRGAAVAVVERNTVVSAAPELMCMGIRAGHSRRQAKHICPEVVFVEQDTESSQALANTVWDVCAGFTPLVEPAGLDCCFIDITGCGEASSIINLICRRCEEQFGVSLYICVAPTKLVARAGVPDVGSKDRVAWVQPESSSDFLASLPVEALWPLGRDALDQLYRLGVSTVAQLRAVPLSELTNQLGAAGMQAYYLSRGVDHSNVKAAYPEASVNYSMDFDKPLSEWADVLECIRICAASIGNQLEQAQASASCVELVIRYTPDGGNDPGPTRRRITLRTPAGSPRTIEAALTRAAQAGMEAPISSLEARALNLVVPESMQLSMFTAFSTVTGRVCPRQAGGPGSPGNSGNAGSAGRLGGGMRDADDEVADLARAVERIRQRFGARSILTADAIITSRRDRMIAASMI